MIRLIVVGKIKKKELSVLIDEYIKQMPDFLTIVELKDETIEKECLSIEKMLNRNNYLIVCYQNGEELDSIELAKKIDNIQTFHSHDIDFVVGGSDGVDERIKMKADMLLSFSKLTFSHQVFRLMLVEQIYRVKQILAGHPYHK